MQQKDNNYAFIDGNNLHLGIRDAGWAVDYRKLRVYLTEKYSVNKAFLFLGFAPQYQQMYQRLQEQGFILVFKPVTYKDGGEMKGNCDVLLTLNTILEMPNCDGAVLITNDGDFSTLVDHVVHEKKLKAVLSPQRAKCSPLLRISAKGQMAYMDDLRDKLYYKTH